MFIRPFLFLIALLLLGAPPLKARCVDWPSVMIQGEIERLPKGKTRFVIESFQDDTKVPGDDWLEEGIPYLLMQYLSTPEDSIALPKRIADKLPAKQRPKFYIGGQYQHLQSTLRVFIQLKNASGKLLAQFPVEAPFPHSKEFFINFRISSEKILNKVGIVDIREEKLREIQNVTDSVRAFENMSRGRDLFYSFDPDKMESALVWFQESKNQDVHYREAYLGMSDAYAFLGLDKKQRRKPFGNDIQKAEGVLMEMKHFVKGSGTEPLSFATRVINANVHFITALHAAEQKQWGDARTHLKNVLNYTPEDSITYFHLANIYAKLGNSNQAKAYKKKSKELNSCL